MAKLPKNLIKKYGISKKAWSVFKSQKATKRKTTTRSVKTMARRKGHTKKHSSFKKGFNMGTILNILTGAAIAAAYEIFVSPMIPLAQNIKNWLELAIGLFLAMMPKMPVMVRSAGVALATVNAYAIIYPMLSGAGSTSTSNQYF